MLPNVDHFVPFEAPDDVVDVVDEDGLLWSNITTRVEATLS